MGSIRQNRHSRHSRQIRHLVIYVLEPLLSFECARGNGGKDEDDDRDDDEDPPDGYAAVAIVADPGQGGAVVT